MPVRPHQPIDSMVLRNSHTHHRQPVQLELSDKPLTCKRVDTVTYRQTPSYNGKPYIEAANKRSKGDGPKLAGAWSLASAVAVMDMQRV